MADFKSFDGVPVLDGAASRHRLLVVDASPAHLGVHDFDLLLARVRRLLSRSATVANLRRANAALDARVVSRAIEIGELRDRLEASLDESRRLEASIRQLELELRRGEAGQPVAGAQPRV